MKKILFTLVLALIFTGAYSQKKSYKRGVAYGHHSAADIQEFSKFLSWWYNWGTQPESAVRSIYRDYDMDFTPMAWNRSGISGVKSWVEQDTTVKYILGFNEPNFKEQSNITPSQAAAAWPAFQQIAEDHNLKIVSPAVNYCGNCVSENGTTYTNPFTYLDDFFDACTDCQVDYIALHWYGGGSSMMGYIDDGRKYGKPIWVTEFAAWDGSVSKLSDQMKYLAGTVNFLERDPDVYRYSWFIGRTSGGIGDYPYIDLYGASGMLTELGQLYADIPVYDPDMRYTVPCRIEAEEYYLMSGLFSEPTADEDGFLNIGWTDVGDWAEYKITVEKSGTYSLDARISGSNGGAIDFLVDDVSVGRLSTPSTGGWQNWKTVSMDVDLEAGEHMLKMLVRDAGFNINWIELSNPTATAPEFKIVDADVYPNPVNNGIITITLNGVNAGEDYICLLYDINGRTVFSEPVEPERVIFQLNLNRDGKINPGIYYLTITGKDIQARKKLVVQ